MTVTKFIFQQIEEKSCLFLGNLSISQACAGLQCLNSEGYTIIKKQEIFSVILWQLLSLFYDFLKWIWHLAKMTVTSVTFQQFGRSHYVLQPTDPCISASTDLWILGCWYLYIQEFMYLHIHVSLDCHTVEPLLTHTPQWTVWAMVYKGLWANRDMVKNRFQKSKKMQKTC